MEDEAPWMQFFFSAKLCEIDLVVFVSALLGLRIENEEFSFWCMEVLEAAYPNVNFESEARRTPTPYYHASITAFSEGYPQSLFLYLPWDREIACTIDEIAKKLAINFSVNVLYEPSDECRKSEKKNYEEWAVANALGLVQTVLTRDTADGIDVREPACLSYSAFLSATDMPPSTSNAPNF
jgi:hypothetical protein